MSNTSSSNSLMTQTSPQSGYLNLTDLPKVAVGLNIEGYRPTFYLPDNCKWYNIVQAIDEPPYEKLRIGATGNALASQEPLNGMNFDDVMAEVKKNDYPFIEQAVGINISEFIDQVVTFVQDVARNHLKVLVHVHQFMGTTKLADVIQEKTGIKSILDKTHFYDYPTIYSEDYPNTDALISISQCAGIGIKAGQWIVPTSFTEFDVKNNIIYTNKREVKNYAEPYVKFPYVKGNILMVNDLWNPRVNNFTQVDPQEGILLFDQADTRVFEFVKNSTQIFDDSHNWEHALCVARNSTFIRNTKRTLHLALLHDVCDHKYTNSIPRCALTEFITIYLTEYAPIDPLIERVSYTYSKKNPDDPYDADLEAVRDGDRMEALKQVGVHRCIKVTTLRGGKVPEDVIIHCYDKLLRLLPEKYIRSDIGRKMAVDGHNVIVKYVIDNLPKTTLTYDPPTYISQDQI